MYKLLLIIIYNFYVTGSTCLNYDELLHENEQLKKKISEIEKLQEERLNQQAKMFHTLMKHKEAALENKIKLIKVRNKTLKKNRERKEKSIKNLKSLFKHIKDKHILENDAASRLTNEFENLLAPLLQNEKKIKIIIIIIIATIIKTKMK